jgi:hypothetical protein
MNINGPIVKKSIHIPAHNIEVLDIDAYWNLDYQGQHALNDEPMCLYAKAAWPTVAEAQRQFRMEAQAREAEREEGRKRTLEARRTAREARNASGRVYAARRAQEAQA